MWSGGEPSGDAAWDWGQARAACLVEARRWLTERSDAEDAAQAAVLRAWRSKSTAVRPEARQAWLRAIARNEALRHLGRRSDLAIDALPEPEDRAASRDIDQAILAADLARAMKALPHSDRRLLALRYGEDLTQPEVAKRIGVAEGTAKVRLHRARQRIAKALGEP